MTPQIKTLKDLMAVAPMFGTAAVAWVQKGIDESARGEDEEVIAEDSQIMHLLLGFADREQSLVQDENASV